MQKERENKIYVNSYELTAWKLSLLFICSQFLYLLSSNLLITENGTRLIQINITLKQVKT